MSILKKLYFYLPNFLLKVKDIKIMLIYKEIEFFIY